MARRANGDGSIFWDETARAYVGLIDLPPRDGKRRRKRIQRATKSEVAAAIRDLRNATTHGGGAAIALDRFLDEWLASPDVTRLRQSTRESYADTLRLHVRPFLGLVPLAELRPARLDDWLAELARTQRTLATIRYAKIVLRIAVQRAVRRDLLPSNPVSVLRVRGGTRRAPQALTAGMVATLLDSATPPMRVAILLGALGGLRRGEVCGLQWNDIDWASSALHVERSISAVSGESEPKTAAGRRLVPVPGLVIAALAAQRRRLELASAGGVVPPWIFPATNGRPKHPRNFLHAYEHARTRAGFPSVRFHDLRHTCATALLSLGNDLKAVSQMLGHAGTRTTLDMYHHPDRGLQRDGAQALQRWIQAANPVEAE